MKTAEQFLREAFGDKANQLNQNVEFLKGYHFGQYPDSVQRTYIYEAMRLVSEEKDRRIRELEEENERLKENQSKQNIAILNHLCDKTELIDEKSRIKKEAYDEGYNAALFNYDVGPYKNQD